MLLHGECYGTSINGVVTASEAEDGDETEYYLLD